MRIFSGENVVEPQEITVTTDNSAFSILVILVGGLSENVISNVRTNTISNTGGVADLNIKLGLEINMI